MNRGEIRGRNTLWALLLLASASALNATGTNAQLLQVPRQHTKSQSLLPPAGQATPRLPAAQPRGFELVPGQQLSYGMPIGQPGEIAVRISAAGEPVVAWIERPDGRRSAEQSVRGEATLQAQVSLADVQAGPLWRLVLKAAERGQSGSPLQPIVRGTVTISHPPPDMARLEFFAHSKLAKHQLGAVAQPIGDPDAVVRQEQQALNARDDEQRQARQRESLQQAIAALRSGQPLQKVDGTRSEPVPTQPVGGLLAARPLPAAPAPQPSVAPVGASPSVAQATTTAHVPPVR